MSAEREPNIVKLYMVQAGWAEETRIAAQPTLLPLGGVGSMDTPSPTFFAWHKAQEVGTSLDAELAVLAVVSWSTPHAGKHDRVPLRHTRTSRTLKLVRRTRRGNGTEEDCGSQLFAPLLHQGRLLAD